MRVDISMEKLPPIEKISEAWSALADARVKDVGENRYTVLSSDGAKTYTILYNPENNTYASNDSATFWQGYPGYPVLAVMMHKGILPYDPEVAKKWKDINWNALNRQMKRNYAAVVDKICGERSIDRNEYLQFAGQILDKLSTLPASVKRLTGIKP